MRRGQLAIALLLVITLTNSQNTAVSTTVSTPLPLVQANPTSTQPLNKGVTMQATVWPSYQTNWAGRISCNNCNPFEGDQPCTKALPILCISNAKKITRPYYEIQTQYTPFAVLDGGFYEGWTGGVFTVTQPVRGSDILNYTIGDNLCKGYFGNNSNFATFDQGYYMDFMNQSPWKAWWLWDWNKVKQGSWNYWGYFNHHYRGRAWVWANGQANGNCGN